ncbi:MAG: SIR2 family protein, partial [Ignavibacteria bacterium]|nr:SIR2 family protein [Ignavibacteria bacterium]
MLTFNELFEEIQKHLECTYQNWFFGAGISFNANIPLMLPLTKKIKADILNGSYKDLYLCLENQLPDNSHIEHILSHIGDLLAILYRSKTGKIKIEKLDIDTQDLEKLYKVIVTEIGNLIRYGYKEATSIEAESIGTINKPLVEIKYHKKFVKKLFSSRANLENRSTL